MRSALARRIRVVDKRSHTILAVVGREISVRRALRSGATGPANAVDVILAVVREVVVDDEADVLDTISQNG